MNARSFVFLSQAKFTRLLFGGPSQAKPSQAKPSQAKPSLSRSVSHYLNNIRNPFPAKGGGVFVAQKPPIINPESKATKIISILLAGSILLASCSSTTLIQSDPDGAKIYLDGEAVGKTPYTHRDTKIVGSCMTVRLEKEGYETFNTAICRNEEADAGAIVGGIFLLFPFLWTMKYKPTHRYELASKADNQQENKEKVIKENTNTKSKADRLRELKQLLDEGILTQEEYDKEKKKILEEE